MLMLVITGYTSKENAAVAAQEVFNAVSDHRPAKVLIDCTKLVGRLSIADTYYHVREYPIPLYRPAKLAIVDNPENADYDSFHEITAANVGISMKYFTDIDKAVKWLNQ